MLGELHSHRVVSLFGGDRFKHGIPGKPQGFVKLQWSIEDNPNSSKLSIGDHVQYGSMALVMSHELWSIPNFSDYLNDVRCIDSVNVCMMHCSFEELFAC